MEWCDDVPTLQRLLREACTAHAKAIKRLRHARRQRDEARTETTRLRDKMARFQDGVDGALKRITKESNDAPE
jgi:hypothetical protein